MKLKKSPLQLSKFNLLKFEYEFFAKQNEKLKRIKDEILPLYNIDIDFAWQKVLEKNLVFCKIEINRGANKKQGYSLFVEGVGFFSVLEETSEDVKSNLLKYAAPSIVINEIRNIIRSNTLVAPLGSYLLPTIDIQAQINERFALARQKPNVVRKRVAIKK